MVIWWIWFNHCLYCQSQSTFIPFPSRYLTPSLPILFLPLFHQNYTENISSSPDSPTCTSSSTPSLLCPLPYIHNSESNSDSSNCIWIMSWVPSLRSMFLSYLLVDYRWKVEIVWAYVLLRGIASLFIQCC